MVLGGSPFVVRFVLGDILRLRELLMEFLIGDDMKMITVVL